MRVGITCYPTYGGSGAVATELGLELARRGHDVHFIAYASPFRLRGVVERVTFHEVAAIDYPLFEQSPHALALAVKQHEVAQRERLDLLHVHYAIPFATTAWLAKQMMADERDLRVVTTLHGTDITLVGQDTSYFTITKFSIERPDRVTAAPICFCCRRRASRSASPPSRRWRARCPSWPAESAGSRKLSPRGKRATWPPSVRWMR